MIKKRLFLWRIRLQLKARKLKKIHFGSKSKNLYDVLRIFIQQLKKDDINERAGSMAFSYTIALFPLLLFLLNLVPYLQDFFPMVTTANILSFVQFRLVKFNYTSFPPILQKYIIFGDKCT
jgi:membrane protein